MSLYEVVKNTLRFVSSNSHLLQEILPDLEEKGNLNYIEKIRLIPYHMVLDGKNSA